jgi:hypothetical protein
MTRLTAGALSKKVWQFPLFFGIIRSFAELLIIWISETGAVPSGKLLRNATDLHPEQLLTHLRFALKNAAKAVLEDER